MSKAVSGVIINQAACVGCKVCMEICPPDVLGMDANQKAYVVHPQDCQFCFLCVFDCPVDAITIHIQRQPTLPSWYEGVSE
jgi:NAD-dependent dihydropyrimidine dehydrogenase PreA subunit